MSLEAVADKFVELSGRPDLTPGTGLIVDAYWYVNEGQRMLDRMLSEGKAAARYFVDVAAGQILVPIYGCRAIQKVFLSNATGRVELYKEDVQTLRANYAEPKANLDSGQPVYYCPILTKPYPHDAAAAGVTQQWAFEEIVDEAYRATYNALLIMPPPDVTYTLDVWGLWYTDKLVAEEDVSFWTEEHESILLNAALYKLEVQYRNTEGAKDWMNAVVLDINELLKDSVEEEVCEISQMRG